MRTSLHAAATNTVACSALQAGRTKLPLATSAAWRARFAPTDHVLTLLIDSAPPLSTTNSADTHDQPAPTQHTGHQTRHAPESSGRRLRAERAMAAAHAVQLKADGNAAFKAFELDRAVELYSAAIAAAPREPVFIANRSAALYESGRYAAALADVRLTLECGAGSALVQKLAMRAARCALWLDDVDTAERWLAHGSLTEKGSDTGTAAAAAAVPAAMAAQIEAVADKVRACRAAGHVEAQRAAAARAAEVAGADAPALVRGGVRPERGEMFTSGHDPPVSMLAGVRRSRAARH